MKKIFLSMIIALVVSISMVGCGKTDKKEVSQESQTQQSESKAQYLNEHHFKFDVMGLEYYIPEAWKEKSGISISCVAPGKPGVAYIIGQLPYEFIPTEFNNKMLGKMEELKGSTDEEKQQELFMEYASKVKSFFTIVVLDKNMENEDSEIVKEDLKRKETLFSEYKNADKVAEKNNLECYILYNDTPEQYNFLYKDMVEVSEYTEDENKEFAEVINHIEELKESIKLSKPMTSEDKMKEKMSDNSSINFETKTVQGKEINSSIFKEHKITMINVWSTTCGPCKEEMPELQELYEEIKKENIGVNIIGLVTDAVDDETIELAKKILQVKGVEFDNIIPDEKIKNEVLTWIQGTPTTIFVDSEGNIIDEPIIGAFGKETYKNEILEKLKKSE
ncbi:TlpA family protein disulfide reductase [Oceanirhabdus sp. W0125-5]|uniref:TlpA family protein disulfide reductase n=1 Tax=Oceanirhabdus sp. W0125-5 TaxID=2999116 RepID=UPI0022F2E955|nr:TlpA disulfide reductase family protein [Oceanirhabdus sp. W0125-5]WBW97769.1 TlpA disulfide reductase family protein [Oceanirhabdus sp. W0125-5]